LPPFFPFEILLFFPTAMVALLIDLVLLLLLLLLLVTALTNE
jgi:hypothetical protein